MDSDVFMELKCCSADDMMSLTWLEDFRMLMELPGNEQFLQAYENLGLKKLTLSVQLVFWAVAKMFISRYTQPFRENECPVKFDDLSERMAILIKVGLVCLCPADEDSDGTSGYVLSHWAAKNLFYGYDELVRYDQVTRHANLIRCTDIDKKELFYSEDAAKEIDALRNMISPKVSLELNLSWRGRDGQLHFFLCCGGLQVQARLKLSDNLLCNQVEMLSF